MKKFAASGAAVAALVWAAATFAPMSVGSAPESQQISGNQYKAEDTASDAEIAHMIHEGRYRPPADASINKLVVALASAR
jgi:hypothetical protein